MLAILFYTLCIGLTLLAWRGLRQWKVKETKRFYGHPWWAYLEVPTGVSYIFLFGVGFYIGPALIILAGLVRFRDSRDWFEEIIVDTGNTLLKYNAAYTPKLTW